MKVSRKNTVKLERGERRIGNFFFKEENEHIKIQDLNSVFSLRIAKRMPVGIWLDNMLKRGFDAEESLHIWAGALWSLLSPAPDQRFVEDMISISRGALDRHPDWYGEKADATDEEQDDALRGEKELEQFEEDMKNLNNDDRRG